MFDNILFIRDNSFFVISIFQNGLFSVRDCTYVDVVFSEFPPGRQHPDDDRVAIGKRKAEVCDTFLQPWFGSSL